MVFDETEGAVIEGTGPAAPVQTVEFSDTDGEVILALSGDQMRPPGNIAIPPDPGDTIGPISAEEYMQGEREARAAREAAREAELERHHGHLTHGDDTEYETRSAVDEVPTEQEPIP